MIFLEYKADAEQVVDRIFGAINGHYKGFPLSVSMGVASTNEVGVNMKSCSTRRIRRSIPLNGRDAANTAFMTIPCGRRCPPFLPLTET